MKRSILFLMFTAIFAVVAPVWGGLVEAVPLALPTDWEVRVNRPAGVAIGGFDIDLAFNPAVIGEPIIVTFGPHLGTGIDAITTWGVAGPGVLNLLELSLLDNAVLIGMQPSTFVLATVTFTSVAAGNAGVAITRADISDGFGGSLSDAEIPEPGTLLLLGAGLLLTCLVRRRST